MEAKVTWQKELAFLGTSDSGYVVKMDSHPGPHSGTSPVQMVAMALAGCTAMDVISILMKKRQEVTRFEVQVHAERAADHPKVITQAQLEYVVSGHALDETAVLRAIELSLTKYCSVHAMLSKAFPIAVHYSIYEDEGNGQARLIKRAPFQHGAMPAAE